MKKIGSFLKKHKKFLISALCLVLVAGSIGIGFDLKEKNKWKRHPVEVGTYEVIENDDIETIRARITQSCIEDNREKEKDAKITLEEIISRAKDDGTFEGLNYHQEKEDNKYWQPLDHLKFALRLQVAYHDEQSPYYNDPAVKDIVTKSMNNWIENDYKCPWNWWENDIGVGQYIPDILLLGVDGVSDESRDKLLSNMKGIQLQNEQMFNGCTSRMVDSSGGNLTDKALSTLKVAVLQNDGNTIKWITDLLQHELHPFPSYNPKSLDAFRPNCEGIKEDGSFQQHNQLIYFGGYGEVFADGMNKYISLTTGTQFALDNEALNLYADFLLDGMQYVTRGGYRDINASGRGCVRVDGLKGITPQVKQGMRVLLNEPGINRSVELKVALEDRFLSPIDAGAGGHRYFYESDYQVINNANYMATVRTSSSRTRICEYLNGENPFGYYTGLGGTFYYVNGNEYYNVLPLYDWTKIPGTTVRKGFMPEYTESDTNTIYADDNKTGGVSNGSIGANFIDLDNNGVTGKKSYFMFDDAVVCLGAGLTTKEAEGLETTIDQAVLYGDLTFSDGNKINVGGTANGQYSYVHHNRISYLTDAQIDVSAERAQGDWKTVNERMDSKPIEGTKFTISIPHTEKENASYAYTVLMKTNVEKTEEYVQNPRYQVVSNTDEIQAVLDTQTGTLQAVFFNGGELSYDDGKTLKVNKACVVIVENKDGKEDITISSYDAKEQKIKVKTNTFNAKVDVDKKSTLITK